MQRTYLPWLGLAAGLAMAAAGTGRAASLFNGLPLDQQRFAVLAQPVGRNDWKLLVLEQIKPEPRCWQERADGLIDPALNRFDFSGIFSRYIDSNGYSLRVGGDDLGSSYRLRLKQEGAAVELVAMSPSQPTELLVGRGRLSQRDREGFVLIRLAPGWELQRRAYATQTLSHVYLANDTPLAQLLARANSRGSTPAALAPSGPLPAMPSAGIGLPTSRGGDGPVALQVVPFQP